MREKAARHPRAGRATRAAHDVFERGAALERNLTGEIILDQGPRLTIRDHQATTLGEQRGEARVRLALVTPPEQQHVRTFHRDHGHGRGGDVGRFGVVDPQYAIHFPHRLQTVVQRTERAQPFSDAVRRDACLLDGEGARQRVRDVVVTEQMQLVAFEERLRTKAQRLRRAVIPRIGRLREREQHAPARRARGQFQHQRIIAVEHPDVLSARVAKQQPLVRVIGIGRRIPVQMIGSQVRQDADFGREVRAVVQLK